ncbi:phasin family protein [bacterium AH-315-P15]|nr:phasin family protein [bacterium AH-315-P15]
MATKAKTTGTTEAVEETFTAGTQAMQEGFDKAVLGYDDLAAASKDNVEAFVEAVSASQKGFEAINGEAMAYSKQAMEDGVAATKAAFGAKSVQELIELNTGYTKAAFEAYVGTATKISELFTTTAKDATAPLNARVNEVAEAAQNIAAK